MRRFQSVLIVLLLIVGITSIATAQTYKPVHIVQSSDNLTRIANYYLITEAELLRVNGLVSADEIQAGLILRIPSAFNIVSPIATQDIQVPEQAPAQSLPAPATTHLIQTGETLSQIAAQYGVDLQDIMAANGIINMDYIQAGQELIIPAGGVVLSPDSPQPSVDPTDTTPLRVIPLVPFTFAYVVQQGDTLAELGQRFDIAYPSIIDLNQIQNSRQIFPGQILYIPTPDLFAQTASEG